MSCQNGAYRHHHHGNFPTPDKIDLTASRLINWNTQLAVQSRTLFQYPIPRHNQLCRAYSTFGYDLHNLSSKCSINQHHQFSEAGSQLNL